MKAIAEKIETLLIKNGTILDLESSKRTKADIVVKGAKIEQIGKVDGDFGQVVDATDCVIVPGLIDIHVHLREPGREDKETIESGCAAAMAGGFTAVSSMPNTTPACDKQEVVKFIKDKAEPLLVDVFPMAAITKGRKGEEITEMAELFKSGAIGFTDDGSPVINSAVMRRALEYSSMYNVPISDHCEDPYLFCGGHMNESIMSTKLGIPGIPNATEDIMVARNIALAELTGGHCHMQHISTKNSVELVRRAKEKGIKVSCEVTPHHLALTDEAINTFSTHAKMNPPLRRQEDIDALMEGLKDGTIQVIASDHAPHTLEDKDVEFNAAPFGVTGLETTLGIINTFLVNKGVLSLEAAMEKMCISPRKLFNIPVPVIEQGADANITIFNPTKDFTVDSSKHYSKAINTPFEGWQLSGMAVAVVNKGLLWKNL